MPFLCQNMVFVSLLMLIYGSLKIWCIFLGLFMYHIHTFFIDISLVFLFCLILFFWDNFLTSHLDCRLCTEADSATWCGGTYIF